MKDAGNDKVEAEGDDSRCENKRYKCGVCLFVCYNRYDFQVCIPSLIGNL